MEIRKQKVGCVLLGQGETKRLKNLCKIWGEDMKRILNYVGSKWNLSSWIINQMPEHNVYLESHFGSGAVLFNKPAARIETINDIDGNIVNLFKVIREQPNELARAIELTPYSREEYYQSFESLKTNLSEIERARVFLVRCWMARGGKTSDRTGWRHNIDIATVNAVPDWNSLPKRISEVTKRLKQVQIENQDATTLIERYNKADCLIYADPPYLLETRTKRHYAHEMTPEEHEKFLEKLNQHKGFAIVSGYDSEMYNDILSKWSKVMKVATTEAGTSKQEVLWLNPSITERHHQINIFEVI